MGVPSFYRWLVRKYPNVVTKAREPKEEEEVGDDDDSSCSFDNLYLDMNGIIHPCFHPQDEDGQDPPTTFDEVFQNIFEYIDWLFKIVRPKKLLFLSIDGVAPRAKMNQQRSRRFRTAKDAEIADSEEDRIRIEFEREGKRVLSKQESDVSDSNIITPGTEFMYKLSKAIQVYICSRLNTEHGWNIKVILSDANSPGEGEHKIMKFIRLQRNLPGYDPNTRHCLYGLDADLIMLALATHEIHFSILREDVLMVPNDLSCIQALLTSYPKNTTTGLVTSIDGSNKLQSTNMSRKPYKKPYQFLNIWTLREYLELDLKVSEPPFQIDFERIIDDFIFICFFTGNDFLPHMPSLEIREGGIDLLMAVYRDEFKRRGGYLVDTQKLGDKKAVYVELKKVEKFILSVGAYEEQIFKKRMILRQLMIKRLMREMVNDADDLEIEQEDSIIKAVPIGGLHLQSRDNYGREPSLKVLTSKSNSTSFPVSNDLDDVLKNTLDLKKRLKDVMREKSDIFKQGGLERDKIRFGMPGWRERYYKEKFGAESPREIESIRKDIVEKYVEGLLWVLHYYFFGVRSWTWFYPYHYAPFASDLKGLGKIDVSFDMGAPFKPFDQLMGVLPPRSVCALPKAYWRLITSEHSNLKDYYPNEFDVDIEGKRYLWQAILKLPFIDEKLLLSETKKLENELEEDEVKRNSESKEKIFVLGSHDFGFQIASLYIKSSSLKPKENVREPIDWCASGGINGFISPCMESPMDNTIICATYEFPDSHPHIPRLHEGVTIPEKSITEVDLMTEPLWHEYEGHRPPNRLHIQDRYKKAIYGGKLVSSDPRHPKETWKGACSGWTAGRGRGRGYGETFYTNKYEYGDGWAPNNVESASCSSSVQLVERTTARGRGRMNMSRNRTSESCRQAQFSPSKQFSKGMQTPSGSSLPNEKWIPDRELSMHAFHYGKNASSIGQGWAGVEFDQGCEVGYGESSGNLTSDSYSLMYASNVEKNASSSVGRGWIGAEFNQGHGHGYRGSPSNITSDSSSMHVSNFGKNASSSVRWGRGRGRGRAESNIGRACGYRESPRDQTSGSYSPIYTSNVGKNASSLVGHGWAEFNQGPRHGYRESSRNLSSTPYIPVHALNMGIENASSSVGQGWEGARPGHGYRELSRNLASAPYRPIHILEVGENASSSVGQGWTGEEYNQGPRHGYRELSRDQTSGPYVPVHTYNVGENASSSISTGWAGPEFNQRGGHVYRESPRNPVSGPCIPMQAPNVGENVSSAVGWGRARPDFNQGRGHGYRESPRNPTLNSFIPNHAPNAGHNSSSSVGWRSRGADYNQGRGQGDSSYNMSNSGGGVGCPTNAWQVENNFWPSRTPPKK